MKPYLLLCAFAALSILPTQAAEDAEFKPRLAIDHKAYIDEALAYLLKQQPELKADNLSFSTLNYQYQIMPATTTECDAKECKVVPAAPFQEGLSVSFTVLDSKRKEVVEGIAYEVHDQMVVQFPTPRMPQWFINKGKSSAVMQEPPKK